ncbi:Acyl-CoA thioesterase [Thermomonospora echinospora]|uniref:Acyl-CoA thioesterase n=1 Tax=Thermomonospora echinospora TaxID=1992 RepID=A0A1H6CJ46_9ACTN|nr:thioesterase family protein [Thermomonospora echinospora]SEG73011.1 Acyl-CoA thioesterase [Thermomonospora echinospora]
MGDLAVDAAVTGGDGRYTAELSPEWDAWGPNGGYLAAILVQAARAHSPLSRVASVSCHFVSVGRFAPVELEVVGLRRSKRAESVRCSMRQDGKPIAEALIWLTADHLDGLRHDAATMPEVPGPEQLRSFAELTSDSDPPPLAMWNNIEGKPLYWPEDGESVTPGRPYYGAWYRFPAHTTDDVARQLVLLDVLAWGSAWSAHPPDSGYIAPNLDLNVQFHRPAAEEEWLFGEGTADVAEDGLIGFRTRVWSRGRKLLASGSGQLLCRPDPSIPR